LSSPNFQILLIESLLEELKINCVIPIFYFDNQNIVSQSHNLILHSKIYFACDQFVAILTKSLSNVQLFCFLTK